MICSSSSYEPHGLEYKGLFSNMIDSLFVSVTEGAVTIIT